MEELLRQIRANAQLVVDTLGPESGVSFGINPDSVAWVDGFIERQRARTYLDPSTADRLVDVLGSFLGECLIAAASGSWVRDDGDQYPWVEFPNNTRVNAFGKVRKQFDQGNEGGESIRSFYEIAVEYVATGRLNSST